MVGGLDELFPVGSTRFTVNEVVVIMTTSSRVSACGVCEADVITGTRYECVKFRECVELLCG